MLNEYNFISIFKDELNNFIKYKRSLGYDYKNQIYTLHKLDKTLYDLKLKEKTITKKTWLIITSRKNMSNNYYLNYYYVTKDFCKFLIYNGFKDIYYEDKKLYYQRNYIPTIFTDNEISIIFKSIDNFVNSKKNSKYYRTYYSYSIIIRLMYACGLRNSEAIKLEFNDINLKESTINIIESKRHTSRLVVMSNSMKQCLINYINIFNISDGLIFKNTRKNKIQKETLSKFYKSILKNNNLNYQSRLYDLRHNFCNTAFNQMLEKGYDENVVIVYLYKYMGHKSIAETEYYLHFTDYNKQKIISSNDSLSKFLYEGVDLDNE